MIGLAGCGRMGLPMLEALRDAGCDAIGLDIVDKDRAWIGRDPAAFAYGLETLFVVLRDATQIETLLFGKQNLVARAAHLRRIIICSTVSPRFIAQLSERLPEHIKLIDAPMSGADVAAWERSLTFMLGGPDEDIDDLMPLLAAMGTHFFRLGPLGSGMQAKVLNNMLAASSTAMTRLVLDWAAKQDVDEDRLLEVIDASSGQNWFASNYSQIEFAEDGHAPDNTIGILVKDVAAAIDAAPRGSETSLPQIVMTTLRNLKPKQTEDIA